MTTLDEAVEALIAGELELREWVISLSDEEAQEAERVLRERIAPLPIAIERSARKLPGVMRRRELERILAGVRKRGSGALTFLQLEREEWFRGGSILHYLRALERGGHVKDLGPLARARLCLAEGAEREAIEEILARITSAPPGWDAEVLALAKEPTIERWDALFRFTPIDLYYERVRYTLRKLIELGADGNMVFRFATRNGVTADATELVREGKVDTEVILARANESTPEGRPLWHALAARAACLHGDRLGTIRLLRSAMEIVPFGLLEFDVEFVWEHADEELRDMLERAGIPRPRDEY